MENTTEQYEFKTLKESGLLGKTAIDSKVADLVKQGWEVIETSEKGTNYTTKLRRPYSDQAQPKKGKKKFIKYFFYTAAWIYLISLFLPESEEEKQVRLAKQHQEQEECKKDLKCWGEKNANRATVPCRRALEQLPKYSYEWNSLFGTFERFAWNSQSELIIKYWGSNIKIQNTFGAWRTAEYYCVYDTINDEIIEVAMW